MAYLRSQAAARWLAAGLALASTAALGCETEDPDAGRPDSGTPDSGSQDLKADSGDAPPYAPAPAPARPGWQESGALALFKSRDFRSLYRTVAAEDGGAPDAGDSPDGGLGPGEWIEVSAPIFPRVDTLYMGEGDQYPTTQEGRERLAHEAALTFEFLLERCAPRDPAIARRKPGDPPLSEAQMIANYQAIAECAYMEFGVKPYWIPQLVSDVDLCGRELGPGWRLIGQGDIERLTEADFSNLRDTLDTAAGSFGEFYFSLRVFARAHDGTIQEGRLDPGVQPRIEPLMLHPGWTSRNHHEAGLSLRCLRTIEVIE